MCGREPDRSGAKTGPQRGLSVGRLAENHQFIPDERRDYAQTLEDAVVIMQERQTRLRGVTRLHQPSEAEPLIVITIDELAALSYVTSMWLRLSASESDHTKSALSSLE